MQLEQECPCTKADCKNHGDCVACYKHHATQEMAIFCWRTEHAVAKELKERVIIRLRAAGIPLDLDDPVFLPTAG